MPTQISLRPACLLAVLSFLLITAGCGSSSSTAPTTTGSPATAPAVTLSATTLSFTGTVGTTGAAQVVTLANTGTAALTFSAAPVLGGTNPTAFALMTTCGSTLAPSSTCTLTTTFSPAAAQSYAATITLADNATSSPQTVTLSGTGATTSLPATADLSSTSLTFSTASGSTSAAQNITLQNNGTATLTGLSLALSGSTSGSPFSYTTTCGTTLGGNSPCAISVTFAPSSSGMSTATLTLTDSAANSPQVISLTGTATAAAGTPSLSLSSTALTFPTTTTGTTAAAQMVTLANSGTAALNLTGIALGGTNPTAFARSSTCGATIAAGSACAITVSFSPSAAAAYTAAITLTDNAASSPQTITLSGTGVAPAASAQAVLTPSTLNFPATVVNSTAAAQTVTLANSGGSPLTGIGLSLTGTNAAEFSFTTTCGTTLAAGASCSIPVSFTPSATGTTTVSLSVASSASTLPQTVTLNGSGVAPVASLSTSTLTFPSTTVSTTSGTQIVTLTDSGGATLTINSIVLGGANAANFAQTTTCGTSLAAGASCTVSVTFKPAAASTYSGTLTFTTNGSTSPQTVALSGSGTAATITRTLYTFPESDNSVTPLYNLVNSATKTIDMTMYELVDTTFSADLVAACNRGVKVRVVLDASLEKSSNTPAYNQLNAVTNCSAVWSNTAFQATHQKTITVDTAQTAILSLNLTSRYYSTTRDFGLIENDAADIAAIETTFATDYAAGGTKDSTELSYQPPLGDDLIWSPTTAQAALLGVINGATKTLLVENEEMSAANIVSALEAACQRGVSVHIAMVDTGSYHANFSALEAAGCGLHVYPDTATGLYIHAKAMVADYGLSTQSVYMGSINFSIASMTQNRELGLYLSDSASVTALQSVITSDYAGAPPF